MIRVVVYGAFFGYARFFKASAVKLPDGTWNSNDDAVWMFVRIPTNIRDRFLAIVATDLNSPGFPQNIVKREQMVRNKISQIKSRL
jgi:hypothetical protein